MNPIEIIPGIQWVGVLDTQLRVFDVILPRDRHWVTRSRRQSQTVCTVGNHCRNALLAFGLLAGIEGAGPWAAVALGRTAGAVTRAANTAATAPS